MPYLNPICPIVVPFSLCTLLIFPRHEDLFDWEFVPRAVIGLVRCLAVRKAVSQSYLRKSRRTIHPSILEGAGKALPFRILSDQQTCLHK